LAPALQRLQRRRCGDRARRARAPAPGVRLPARAAGGARLVGDDPGVYDLEHADDPAFDVPFWESVVRDVQPRRMLELACGTGRLTLPLARLGVASEVVGLDASAAFLARAASRLDG